MYDFTFCAFCAFLWLILVSLMTILLRFIFGVILAAGLVVFCGFPFPLDLIFVLTVGTMAGIWGDRFILGFMSLMRYFRIL